MVRLSHRYNQPVTVSVSTTNLTAVAPGDYSALLGTTVVIPARSTTSNVNVSTSTDGQAEGAETFRLTASSPSVANSPRNATATIQANGT